MRARGGPGAGAAQATAGQTREPVLHGGERPGAGGNEGAGRRARRYRRPDRSPRSRSRRRCRRSWRRGSSDCRAEDRRLLQRRPSSARMCRSRCCRRWRRPRRMLRRGLKRCRPPSSCTRPGPPDPAYTFKHALTHEVALPAPCRTTGAPPRASRRSDRDDSSGPPHRARGAPRPPCGEGRVCGEKAVSYLRQAGLKAAARSALADARTWFEQALGALETLPESQATLEQAFEIRLELRPVLSHLGEVRRSLEPLLEAATLAEALNDDRRRGRVSAFISNTHSILGELDEALVTGTRALEIAGRLGDPRPRILATSCLVLAHYARGEYESCDRAGHRQPGGAACRVRPLRGRRRGQREFRIRLPPLRLASLLAGHEPRRAR